MVLQTKYILHVDAGESSNLGGSGVVAQSPTTEGNPSAASPLTEMLKCSTMMGYSTSFDIQTWKWRVDFITMIRCVFINSDGFLIMFNLCHHIVI